MLRIALGIVISLTGIIPSLAQAILFLLFVLVSFTFSFLRVFESIFRHVANWLLELSLVLIAIFTIYEEAKGASENVGKGFVIFFTVIQLLVFILILIGFIIDVVKWCYEKKKKRSEVYKIKEIDEKINVNTIS